ncbi:DUF6228 family protein [Kutzneria buriramensis]|uniref:Uncharacterized protein n=1 Tax=Kutzneria buriramensis TaxID=1045776 RepID=A0A3E0IBD3_9PSEU|nr:DUF6228 family protein [Kutzneria buriramensis]REH55901.1 hypothetical protein BCF44_101929 [Kutzneria buriramensis]
MEHECGDDIGVRLGGPQGWVRLWNRTHPHGDDMVAFCIELGGDGMTAVAHGVVVAGESPAAFVEGLAASFEGWSGVRAWQNLDRDVRIEAVFEPGGHVDLTWTVEPWRERYSWAASVTVKGVEAGEQMRRLAADLRELL